jgi:hypothetical protein
MSTIYTVLVQKFEDDPYTPLSSWTNEGTAQKAAQSYQKDHPGSPAWVVPTPLDVQGASQGQELQQVFTASYDFAKHGRIVPPVCIKTANHRWLPEDQQITVTSEVRGHMITVDGCSDLYAAQRVIKKIVDTQF